MGLESYYYYGVFQFKEEKLILIKVRELLEGIWEFIELLFKVGE